MEKIEKEYYKSGALRSEATYRDGVLDGPYKSYYENGVLQSTCQYKAGKKCGNVRHYFENGKLMLSMTLLENGGAHGDWLMYYENGQLMEKCTYDHDVVEGENVCYFMEGGLKSRILYRHGLRHGVSEFCNSSGNRCKRVRYEDDNECESSIIHYYESGMEAAMFPLVDELPEGEAVWYHETGAVAMKFEYKAGMPVDGSYPYFDVCGEPAGHCEYKNGRAKLYNSNGVLYREWTTYRDELNGLYTEYDEQGYKHFSFYLGGDRYDLKTDFQDNTCVLLGFKCESYFGDSFPEYEGKDYALFFANALEQIATSPYADEEYDDYAELEPCDEKPLPPETFLEHIVREFMLRLRLPNDGNTEKEVLEDLKEMLEM